MRHIRRIIGLHVTSGLSVRLISRALNIPPSTVGDYIRRYKAGGLSPSALRQGSGQASLRTGLADIQNLNDRFTIRFCVGQTHTEQRYVERAWQRIQEEAGELEAG